MISVIIPFFNAAGTLDQAVQSIVEQSFSEWELILVDNNSTDHGRRIAEIWVQKEGRIRLLTEVKQGVAHAMNTGIQASNYGLIARMDADDLTHSTRLEKQFSFMQQHPEIDVLATQVQFTSTLEHHKGFLNYVDWQNDLIKHEDIYRKRFVDAPLVQATTLIRRSAYERFGYYNTSNVPDDFELWLRWLHQGMRCAKLPEVLYTWQDGLTRLSRSHPDYSTSSFDAMRFKWLSSFLKEEHPSRPVIILGSSKLCRDRAKQLEEYGIHIRAFSDVSGKPAIGYEFIPPNQLGRLGAEAFLISMISQRGTGDRISSFLKEQGLVEGENFLLSA